MTKKSTPIVGIITGDTKKIKYPCPVCGREITFHGYVKTEVKQELCSKCKGEIE